MVGTMVLAGVTTATQIVRRRAGQQWTPPSGAIIRGSLAARRLGSAGPPIVLIHGMAGSQKYWGADFDVLSEEARLVAVDVLGFGESPKPVTGYGPREHADALAACLHELGIGEPALVVGHSMGALIALALAKYHPETVDRIVTFAPPIYASRADGVKHVRAMGTLEGLMAFGPSSRVLCHWMCNHRESASRLAPLLQPNVPSAIARDTVRHTWTSYSESMEQLILASNAPRWLEEVQRPVHMVVALDDPVPDLPLLSRLQRSNDLLSLDIWSDGGHHLPLTRPAKCTTTISNAVDAMGRPRPPAENGFRAQWIPFAGRPVGQEARR